MIASIYSVKQAIINRILSNSLYQPNSGTVEVLTKGLMRLSNAELNSLEVVIDLKVQDAFEAGDKHNRK